MKCHKAVHNLSECSLPIDGEEGFSQKRLCRICALKSGHSTGKTSPTQTYQVSEEESVTDGNVNNNNNESDGDDDQNYGNIYDNDICNDSNDSIKEKDVFENCVRCNKKFNSQELQPVDDSDDSYSDHKVCTACSKIDKQLTKEMLGKRAYENWKGKGTPISEKKSRSLYINSSSTKISEMLQYERANGLPILKCGDHQELEAVKLEGRFISLVNTCPFDSIFQMLLVAACDFSIIHEKVTELNYSLNIIN